MPGILHQRLEVVLWKLLSMQMIFWWICGAKVISPSYSSAILGPPPVLINYVFIRTFLVVQMVKRLPTMWETQIQSLGWEDPLEKEMATHSSTLAWKIPWTEECGRLQFMGLQRVRHNWVTSLSLSKSHSFSSICDRKVTGDEGPNGEELELRQFPEGCKWVIVQIVRWWRCVV